MSSQFTPQTCPICGEPDGIHTESCAFYNPPSYQRIDTTLSIATMERIDKIARAMGLSKARYLNAVIKVAVDYLYNALPDEEK